MNGSVGLRHTLHYIEILPWNTVEKNKSHVLLSAEHKLLCGLAYFTSRSLKAVELHFGIRGRQVTAYKNEY